FVLTDESLCACPGSLRCRGRSRELKDRSLPLRLRDSLPRSCVRSPHQAIENSVCRGEWLSGYGPLPGPEANYESSNSSVCSPPPVGSWSATPRFGALVSLPPPLCLYFHTRDGRR